MNLESNQMDIKRYKIIGRIVKKKKEWSDNLNRSYFSIRSKFNREYDITLNRIYYVKLKNGIYCELKFWINNIYFLEGSFNIGDFFNTNIYLAYNKYKVVGYISRCLGKSYYYLNHKSILLFNIFLNYGHYTKRKEKRIIKKKINYKEKYYLKIENQYFTLNRCLFGYNVYWIESKSLPYKCTQTWFDELNKFHDYEKEAENLLIWELNTDDINDYKYH